MNGAFRRLSASCFLVFASALMEFAKAQGPPQVGRVRTARQQFKNIQVLKETPANKLVLSMHLMAGDLGVGCNFCHVEVNGSIEGQFEKDDKETKQTARKMIKMVMDLNNNSFGGQQAVTCYTCHRGSPKPLSVPLLPVTLVTEGQPRDAVLPTADQILTKYVKALGGELSIRKVTSRVITATRDIPTGPGGVVPVLAQIDLYERAPNLFVNISRTDKFATQDGFDGTTAWSQNAAGVVIDIPDPDQTRARRRADFYECLSLAKEYTRLDVQSIEKVNHRDAFLIVAFPKDDSAEQLYFDVETGLLLRKLIVLSTPAGDVPFQTDYEDYQDTGSGVKIPFVIRMLPASERSELQTSSTVQIQKVQDNVPIDGRKFVKPQSKASTAR
jgi:photosynthetic reaction center cytochrome c subunit